MKSRIATAMAMLLVVVVSPWRSEAQGLGSAFERAREYVREMKENTSSSPGSRESSPSESSSVPERDAARDAERARRREERDERRAEEQRERQRIESNLVRLDEWLDQAAYVSPASPPVRPAGSPPATISQRRRQLDSALVTANRPEFAVETSRTTLAGVSVNNRVRLARGVQIRNAIVNNATVRIQASPSSEAAYPNPWYSDAAEEMVTGFDGWVRDATRGSSIDPDLVRAIIWMESTHGWYDGYKRTPSTLLPMNVHTSFWRDLGVSRSDLKTPRINIKTGVRLVEVLWKSVEQPTIEKVATLYNDLGREAVSGYGKTVGHYYTAKPWLTER